MSLEDLPLRQLDSNLVFTFTYSGNLNIEATQMRLYNDTDNPRVIKYVRASVGTASIGAGIVIDVLKNGESIFTSGNPATPGPGSAPRVLIAATGHTSKAKPKAGLLWEPDDYLTVSINQIGSTFAGADLTINVVVSE